MVGWQIGENDERFTNNKYVFCLNILFKRNQEQIANKHTYIHMNLFHKYICTYTSICYACMSESVFFQFKVMK